MLFLFSSAKPKARDALAGEVFTAGDEAGLEEFFREMKLLTERDTEKTVVLVFRTVVLNYKKGEFSSTQVSRSSGLNRLTCIHHLKRLKEAGLVEKNNSKYVLSVESLDEFVLEAKREMLESFAEMELLAAKLDESFFGKESKWLNLKK